MPISVKHVANALISACVLSAAPLAFATIVAPAPSWATCGADGQNDCQPGAGPAAPAPPPAIPPFGGLSPSDVDLNVTGSVSPPSVSYPWPQLCLPAFQTGIPFVGFQPCI